MIIYYCTDPFIICSYKPYIHYAIFYIDPLQGPGHCNLPWTLASLSVTLNGFLFLGLFLLVVAW